MRTELERTQKPSVLEFDTGVLLQFLFRSRSTHWHFMLTVGPVPPSYCHAHVTPVNAGDQRQAVITCHIMPRENMLVFLTAAPRRCANTTQCCHATTRWPATEVRCRCCSAAVRLKRPSKSARKLKAPRFRIEIGVGSGKQLANFKIAARMQWSGVRWLERVEDYHSHNRSRMKIVSKTLVARARRTYRLSR